ncbi:lysozyme family protein [Bacillus sp. NPDC077027]|uniref:lysozyme family protein n=1 Tax=Bacillus sp. NPDC077027 TaxID=3390548 RepID=UPI003D02190F
MKKRKTGCFAISGCFTIFLFVFISAAVLISFHQKEIKKLPIDTETIVLSRLNDYKPLVETELRDQDLVQYTSLILGMMYQESKGRGGDPMQSSESLGLKRNEINDPDKSIKQGVHHFSAMYKHGKKKGVDLETIIQSYNMGTGYIDFVAKNGGKHSEDLAKQYSEKQVKRNPKLYTCGGNKDNFRYPYCFGDFTYAKKVKEKTKTVEEKMNLASSSSPST